MDTPQQTVKTATVVIQKALFEKQKSNVEKYQDLIIGRRGLWALIKHELVTLLSSWVPGALGMFLRSKLYPLLLGSVGRNVSFGANVVLRHSHKIFISDNVVVDDNCVLDAKGQDNRGIVIGEGVFLGRNTILSCKNGDILLSDNANIGFNCVIASCNFIKVGKNVLMAAYTYLIGGDHDFERIDVPILDQGRRAKGIDIEDNVWLGVGVKVLDGVTVGRDSIIGTSAVVSTDIPEFSIAVGIPAKVLKKRSPPSYIRNGQG